MVTNSEAVGNQTVVSKDKAAETLQIVAISE